MLPCDWFEGFFGVSMRTMYHAALELYNIFSGNYLCRTMYMSANLT